MLTIINEDNYDSYPQDSWWSRNKNKELRKDKIKTGDPDLDDDNRENLGGKDMSLKYNNA
jgi:hypothetical protein